MAVSAETNVQYSSGCTPGGEYTDLYDMLERPDIYPDSTPVTTEEGKKTTLGALRKRKAIH